MGRIKFLKTKIFIYSNILKWLIGCNWGIDSLQALNFVNATIIAQLMWGSMWYLNAADSNVKLIESVIVSTFKLIFSLLKNSSNKICCQVCHFQNN